MNDMTSFRVNVLGIYNVSFKQYNGFVQNLVTVTQVTINSVQVCTCQYKMGIMFHRTQYVIGGFTLQYIK